IPSTIFPGHALLECCERSNASQAGTRLYKWTAFTLPSRRRFLKAGYSALNITIFQMAGRSCFRKRAIVGITTGRSSSEISADRKVSPSARLSSQTIWEECMLTSPKSINGLDIDAARKRCRRYRRRILDISQQVTALHIAPAFSCTEITDAIYNTLMRQRTDGSYRDVFMMSKGHGCMIQYVILEDKKILSSKDLDLYCKPGGRLGAHPD